MTGCGLRLWARHPVRTVRAWLWLARQSAPAFDRAGAERDRLRAARDAVRLALPGRTRAVRRARAGVLRELNAGRLAPAAAVAASGLMDRPGVHALHRAALAAALGGTAPDPPPSRTRCVRRSPPYGPALLAEIASVRAGLRTEIAAVRTPAADGGTRTLPVVDRAALVAGLADQIRDAISSGERWAPDYDALMERTGFRRSWCEKAVRDARTAAFAAPRHRLHGPGPYGRLAPVPTRPPRRPSPSTDRPGRGSDWTPSAAPRPSPGGIPIMSTEFDLGQDPAPEPPGPGGGDRDADVLFLNPALDPEPAADHGAGRGGRPPALPPPPEDGPDSDGEPGDDDDVDRESVLVGRVVPGRPVDPPDGPRPFAPRGHRKDRPPVIPPALASRAAMAATLTWAAREARYHAGFHAVRAPEVRGQDGACTRCPARCGPSRG